MTKWEYSSLSEGWHCTNCGGEPFFDAEADNGYSTPFEYNYRYCPYCGSYISECVGKKRKPWDDIDPYESLVITW